MPVEPVVNFQIAMSSRVVGAGSSASGASAASASKLASPVAQLVRGHADGEQLARPRPVAERRARLAHPLSVCPSTTTTPARV